MIVYQYVWYVTLDSPRNALGTQVQPPPSSERTPLRDKNGGFPLGKVVGMPLHMCPGYASSARGSEAAAGRRPRHAAHARPVPASPVPHGAQPAGEGQGRVSMEDVQTEVHYSNCALRRPFMKNFERVSNSPIFRMRACVCVSGVPRDYRHSWEHTLIHRFIAIPTSGRSARWRPRSCRPMSKSDLAVVFAKTCVRSRYRKI